MYGLYLIDIDKKQEEENRISEKKYEDIVDYSPLLTPDKLINGSQNFVFNSLVISSDDERELDAFFQFLLSCSMLILSRYLR